MNSTISVASLILLLWYNFISCRALPPVRWIMRNPPTSQRNSITKAEIEAADCVYQAMFKIEKNCNRKPFLNALRDAGARHFVTTSVHQYGPRYSAMIVSDIVDPDLFRQRMHFYAVAGKDLPELIRTFEPVPKIRPGRTSGAGPSSVLGAKSSGFGKTVRVKFRKVLKNVKRVFSLRKKKGNDDDVGDYHPLPQSPSDES